MVRASNPKLMSKVLGAVIHLRESKGSSARDILQLVNKGSTNRNLTMQVQRALKHAVTAGILKHRNGRYKAAIAFAVTSAPKRRRPGRTEDDYKVAEEMPDVDESTTGVDPLGPVHDRKRRRKRGGSRKRRGSKRRGRSGRRGMKRRRGRRVKKHTNEEFEDMGPTDRKKMSAKSRIREDESAEHKNQKSRNSDKYSDISGSDHESRHQSRKSKPEHLQASRRSTSRSRAKEELSEESNNNINNNRRSSSRHRSQPRNTQPPNEDLDVQNSMDCEHDPHDDEADNDICEPKNCGSDCSLA